MQPSKKLYPRSFNLKTINLLKESRREKPKPSQVTLVARCQGKCQDLEGCAKFEYAGKLGCKLFRAKAKMRNSTGTAVASFVGPKVCGELAVHARPTLFETFFFFKTNY